MKYVDAARETLLVLLLINSVYTDIRKGKIPNAVPLTMSISGILFMAVGGGLMQLPERVLTGACTVLFLYPLWKMRSLGAGDIKLFAALALFLRPGEMMVCIALSFVLSLLPAAVLLLKGNGLKARVHFAVPIALAAAAVSLVPGLGQSFYRIFGVLI